MNPIKFSTYNIKNFGRQCPGEIREEIIVMLSTFSLYVYKTILYTKIWNKNNLKIEIEWETSNPSWGNTTK